MKISELPPHVRKQVEAKLPPKPKRARGMNRWEREFESHLRARYPKATIYYEDVTLRLGHDCRYTPDFFLVDLGDIEAYEVKGFRRDDALVKIRVAARMFPWITFRLVEREKGGGWKITPVPS